MSQAESSSTMAANHIRKKAGGVKPWLLLESTGQTQLIESGKQSIMRRTGLPARDLRILDPLLAYPSTVLGRERAIVINLEHIKAIITANELLLANARDPCVVPFVDELQGTVSRHFLSLQAQECNADNRSRSNLYNSPRHSQSSTPQNGPGGFSQFNQDEEDADRRRGLESRDGSKILPFEFVALEACLEEACSSLGNEARTLELEAHPALDKLTSKISTLNLERVRQIKSRLVAITGRVQKVRDELEQLLDDDEDMAEMYLSEKLTQQLDGSSINSENERGGIDDEALRSDLDERDSADIPHSDTSQFDNANGHSFGATNVPSKGSHGTHSPVSKHFGVVELEMLLEAYFVQIDGTLNKLSTLREYVDDTEDYINIMLDDKQNHLLQMGVMLTTATLVLSAFLVVTGIFGMNIKIDLFDKKYSGNQQFLWTVGGGTIGSIFLYVFAMAWCKKRGLLE